MLYIKRSRLKTLLDGWMAGWLAGKAGLRIAYSNQKLRSESEFIYFLNKNLKMLPKLKL
jgi:hypothetical protein